jgi:hypothetical protein
VFERETRARLDKARTAERDRESDAGAYVPSFAGGNGDLLNREQVGSGVTGMGRQRETRSPPQQPDRYLHETFISAGSDSASTRVGPTA